MSARLTQDEVRAWCEKYASTPWNGLALAVAANGDPSPLVVLKSAVLNAERAETANTRLREALNAIAEKAQWYADNLDRLPQEVDHALCVEVLALAQDAEQENA